MVLQLQFILHLTSTTLRLCAGWSNSSGATSTLRHQVVDMQMIKMTDLGEPVMHHPGVFQLPVYQEPQVVVEPVLQSVGNNTVYIEAPPPVIPAPQSIAVAVVPAPAPMVQQPMKSTAARTRCNVCQQEVVTMTKPVNGALVWILCVVLFLFFLWPLSFIPFCIKGCKDVEHSCPNCRNVLYVYKRI